MIFMNLRGQDALRKTISYVLLGVGLAIILFPTLIGIILMLLGGILLNKEATALAMRKAQEYMARINRKNR